MEAASHPYIPNSAPETRRKMMRAIGIDDIEELFEAIPEHLRFARRLELPEPLVSEQPLRRHLVGLLERNRPAVEGRSFLGGGCWQHHVPAVVDEVISRAEFLTAYSGSSYPDLGKYQARFEYQSQMAELVGMDVVSDPTYDWANAAALSLRMAARITGRSKVLVPATVGPDRRSVIENLCGVSRLHGAVEIGWLGYDAATGAIDIADLRRQLDGAVAAVYIENPSYLGTLEPQSGPIADLVHGVGGLLVAGVDPLTLGLLEAPSRYGADIVCGDIQPLGTHMSCGGGLSGFMAFPDEERFVSQCPLILFGVAETLRPGELGFGEVMFERTSYALRDQARDWVGTSTGLMGIAAAVYLALMGPAGLRELGETIVQRAHYAADRLGQVPGVKVHFGSNFFKEFVVDFRGTGKSVEAVNRALSHDGIFGGLDLGRHFDELTGCALYCVTELHTGEDIDALALALEEAVS
jgi:glycine cleavage system P protein (glycine dehydrogenase) subunit 1